MLTSEVICIGRTGLKSAMMAGCVGVGWCCIGNLFYPGSSRVEGRRCGQNNRPHLKLRTVLGLSVLWDKIGQFGPVSDLTRQETVIGYFI